MAWKLPNIGNVITSAGNFLSSFKKPEVISPLPAEPTPKMTRTPRGSIRLDFVQPSPTITPSPTPTPTPAPNFGEMTEFEKLTADTFDKYKVPRAVAFGIAAAEGGKRNKFNIGAVDANPGRAPVWDDLETATKAAKLLSGTANPEFYGNGEVGKLAYGKAYEQRASPSAMLKLIEEAGYAGDPRTWKARSKASGGAGNIYSSWSDFIMDTPAWKKWIK